MYSKLFDDLQLQYLSPFSNYLINGKKMNDKKKLLIVYLTNVIKSQITITTHREIAAWTIIAFYLTGLIIISKYLYENIYSSEVSCCHLLIAIISIILLCFIVFVFIHSQYGSHVSNRAEIKIYRKTIFKLINNDIPLEKDDCKVKGLNHYPLFLLRRMS